MELGFTDAARRTSLAAAAARGATTWLGAPSGLEPVSTGAAAAAASRAAAALAGAQRIRGLGTGHAYAHAAVGRGQSLTGVAAARHSGARVAAARNSGARLAAARHSGARLAAAGNSAAGVGRAEPGSARRHACALARAELGARLASAAGPDAHQRADAFAGVDRSLRESVRASGSTAFGLGTAGAVASFSASAVLGSGPAAGAVLVPDPADAAAAPVAAEQLSPQRAASAGADPCHADRRAARLGTTGARLESAVGAAVSSRAARVDPAAATTAAATTAAAGLVAAPGRTSAAVLVTAVCVAARPAQRTAPARVASTAARAWLGPYAAATRPDVDPAWRAAPSRARAASAAASAARAGSAVLVAGSLAAPRAPNATAPSADQRAAVLGQRQLRSVAGAARGPAPAAAAAAAT